MAEKTAILICTYDGAKDLWGPLHQTYEKYWPDCPYNLYLATNEQAPRLKLFSPLCIGKEDSWSDNVIKCLRRIPEPYVMLTFDDLFLPTRVNTGKLLQLSRLIEDKQWDYLRLHPSPSPDDVVSINIGRIRRKREYRASTVWAIFNKKVLFSLLNKSESAWDFERNGSVRSDRYGEFYCVRNTVIVFLNGVVKGKWVPTVRRRLLEDGVELDSSAARGIMSFREHLAERTNKVKFQLALAVIPASCRYAIKKMLAWRSRQ